MDVYTTLFEMGLTCLVLFLSGLLAHRIGLSFIPLYILAGLFLGRFVQHTVIMDFMSTIGMILLMFIIGLEFSFGNFLKNRRQLLPGVFYDLVLNLPTGLLVGLAMGLDILTSLFLSGIVYVSSSAIICKGVIDFKRSANPETECLLGILVFEDIFIAIYLAVLSGIATLGRLEMLSVGLAILKALGFCASLFLIARLLRKYLEVVLDVESTELFVLLLFSIIILTASSSRMLGISEAIGAFFAGMIVSETGQKPRAVEVISPFQYLAVAIFFVSFGIVAEYPALKGTLWWVLVLVGVSIPFKLLAGFLAGRGYRLSRMASFRLGLSLLPRGEFSIILAAVAMRLAGGQSLQAMTTLYVLVMAILGSVIMKEADTLARWVEGRK